MHDRRGAEGGGVGGGEGGGRKNLRSPEIAGSFLTLFNPDRPRTETATYR